jgi:hypothetical protein
VNSIFLNASDEYMSVMWCGRVFQVLIERVVECGALVGRCSLFLLDDCVK